MQSLNEDFMTKLQCSGWISKICHLLFTLAPIFHHSIQTCENVDIAEFLQDRDIYLSKYLKWTKKAVAPIVTRLCELD